MSRLPENAERLIEHLRKEANEVKACFTTYSHAAITFSVAAIAAIVSLQRHWGPQIGFAGIVVAIVPLLVVRIGEHKYSAANRYHGYELHIERLSNLPSSARTPLDRRILSIGWEEAMRAWRVVQPTLYEAIHTAPRFLPHRIRMKYRRASLRWFDPSYTVTGPLAPRFLPTPTSPRPDRTATYHAGSYLRTMCGVLYLLVFIALLPMVWALHDVFVHNGTDSGYFASTAAAIVVVIMLGSMLRAEARRAILETGFLSIHACAVVWHAVAVAHLRALDRLEAFKGENSLEGYMWEMARQAISVSEAPLEIHSWIRLATFNEDGVRRWDEEMLRETAEYADEPSVRLRARFDLGVLLASRGLHHEALKNLLQVVAADPHFAREGARRMIEDLLTETTEDSVLTPHYRRALEKALWPSR